MNTDAPKLITLSCPSCGAKLEITPGLDRFACAFCGQEHIVNRAGGTISLSPVVEAIHQVKTGVDRTAAELAIVRIQKEISNLEFEKQLMLKQSPKPIISRVSNIYTYCGVLFLFLTVLSLFANSDMILFCLIVGLIFFFIGIYPRIGLSQKKLVWEQTTGQSIKVLIGRIEEKKAELEKNQNLVRK